MFLFIGMPFFLNLYFLAPKYPLAHISMQILTKSRAIYKYLCTAINLVATIDSPSLKMKRAILRTAPIKLAILNIFIYKLLI